MKNENKRNTKRNTATVETTVETTATATVETTETTTATATNTEKTNVILSVVELKSLFVECNVTPKYTDSTHYVGCGVRANTFSVNALKTQYNVYCDDDNFKLFDTSLFNDCEFTANGNATDKTRPNTIIVKSTETLKKLLSIVVANNAKIALVTK